MAEQTEALTIQEVGRRGGLSRAKHLTSDQRRDIARRAAQARWAKKGAPDPTDPKGPKRDHQRAEAGIMLTRRKPCPARVSPSRPTLFEIPGAA